MAAYAALTSLSNTIHQIQHHPSPPISLNIQQVKSLTENVTFFQEFLEGYKSPVANSKEADPLEMRIASAAHAAEDVIESFIVHMIERQRSTAKDRHMINTRERTSTSAGSKNPRDKYLGFLMKRSKEDLMLSLEQGVRKVTTDMDLIKEDVMKMKMTKKKRRVVVKAHMSASGGSSSRSSIMVGFDDVLLEVLDKLCGGRHHCQVIPIVGMGGIGKTTLVKAVFGNALTKEHFDICAWATISQNYNTKEILCELFSQVYKEKESSNMTKDELGSELYKYLFGRRFMIVLDDMWSTEAWEKIQHFFPKNENGSRILVTTRLSTLGCELDNDNYYLKMKFLDEGSSWKLFSKYVFGEGICPLELEEVGKQIVENCRGLPLSIVVVGGLLKKLEQTKRCWESIRKNSSSIVLNSENEDFCLKILKMSYNHLPVHLKPCFLHMGVFEEDRAVRVSTLVKLWVSEGFLKRARDKSLETIAKEYLNDLVERNLILVHELGSTGNIKYCKLHDLLRDLCLREAGKEDFYYVIGRNNFRGLHRQRCFVIPGRTSKEKGFYASGNRPLARSFICDSKEVLPLPRSRMLRTLKTYDRDTSGSHDYKFDHVLEFVNSRYLAVGVRLESKFPSSLGLLWNLHTLVVFHPGGFAAPSEIWKMRQLRHVEFYKGTLELPNPPDGNRVIMENLQTLKGVRDLNCGVESAKIIPSIKKLGVSRGIIPYNLILLSKLESFRCWNISNAKECTFPYSLKHLSLGSDSSHWELNQGLLDKIGALPLLQKLKLERARFQLRRWETTGDQFPSLKFLKLKWCLLESWMTESSHFPRLEQLHLCGSRELEEIPSEIGEIPTLQSILLEYCSEPVVESAKKITEEQEELRVRVVLFNNGKNQALRRSLSSPPNFLVEIVDF